MPSHEDWMRLALTLAVQAGQAGEVPVGAVIVDAQGVCIAQGENQRERTHDPTAHAEIVALRQAGQVLGTWYLTDCTLYVTLEPCPMCAGALVNARIGQLVYGAPDPKTGAIDSVLQIPTSRASNHHFPVIRGVLAAECRDVLQAWFRQRRSQGKNMP
ncbi:MAG: tRNA adenosine(34) deaminase TadA [Gloeomargarita sp. SKYBB_i_bin120]|nr:tRNA adenosine(34) deaminase TadA [Gloeomargarita sp. SKYG98]MCS7293498.1 tRNA adenosine(34) deaminase TadA [Gloeomargarita sp. SKYB120]MDW8179064.1 tRNA adenosine(34) deaminase TadA [Gloeomargarita sp. SKYBB_i_bin120]